MTRDDLEFMRMVAQHTGRSPALAEREFAKGFLNGDITAAVISKPKLILTTVRFGGPNGPNVLPQCTRVIELSDRSALAVRTFWTELSKFARNADLSEVYLRTASSSQGQYCPHGYHFKIETLLQLLRDTKLTFVSEQSVGSWVRRSDPELPSAPIMEGGRYWATKFDRALETALFVAEHALEKRFFSDGSDADE